MCPIAGVRLRPRAGRPDKRQSAFHLLGVFWRSCKSLFQLYLRNRSDKSSPSSEDRCYVSQLTGLTKG